MFRKFIKRASCFVVMAFVVGCGKKYDYVDLFPNKDYIDKSLLDISIEVPRSVSIDGYNGFCYDDRCCFVNNEVDIKFSEPHMTREVRWLRGSYEKSVLSDFVVSGGKMYYCDSLSNLLCINVFDGTVLWRRPIGNGNTRCRNWLTLSGKHDSLIVVSDYGRIVAFNLSNKAIPWVTESREVMNGGAAIVGDKVVVHRCDNATSAFDIKTGKHLWSINKLYENLSFAYSGNFAVSGDKLLCTYSSGECALLNVNYGDEYWSRLVMAMNAKAAIDLCGVMSAKPVLYKGYAIVSNSRGNMTAINEATGDILWRNNVGARRNICVCGDWIFAVDNDGYLVCVYLKTGAVRYRVNITEQLKKNLHVLGHNQRFFVKNCESGDLNFSNPLIVGGKVMVADGIGSLILFDVNSGAITGSVTYDSVTKFVPINMFVANASIYIVSSDSRVHVVK